MAERRMFAKTIIDSDAFLDMPLTTQALYFHLSMRADDEGFINNPKKIQRMIGASDDDLKVLIAKSFIIPFESGIVVIKHWKIHNYIRGDRLHGTKYTEEKALLDIKENGSYTISHDICQSDVSQVSGKLDTEVRLGKDSIGKDSIISCSSFEHVWKLYPRHDEKKRALECYTARLNAGWTEEELERATKAYAEECKKENREKKYIKQAKTFFGVNEPFSDYLPKQPNFSKNEEIAKKVFLDEVAQWIPPYHGFPEEWFDGDKLVEERVTPLIKPREPKLGWYSEEEVSKKELIEDYYIRKKYVSEHKEEADEFKRKASEADQ